MDTATAMRDYLRAGEARHQRFPDDTHYAYKPPSEAGVDDHGNAAAKAELKDCNRLDLSI
ncbi:MAG: hypothetical protein HKN28_07425 [Alphaproteobacteria bacterium]|nr:hypothetical protein [Alphaproteobacteria bacterium]